jgi:DNA polymerase delta subunit 4
LSKDKKDLTEEVKIEALKAEPVTPEPGHVTPEDAVVQQAKAELSKPKSEAERLAEKVTDAQIKEYWREREAERIVKRGKAPSISRAITRNERVRADLASTVHQEGLSVEEKVLRYFDVSSQYGVRLLHLLFTGSAKSDLP